MSARTMVLATCAAVALLVTAAPKAHAEYWEHDGWRERQYEHARWEEARREREWRWRQHEWREHEWREHNRGYGW